MQAMLSSEELERTRTDLSGKVGTAYDDGVTRRALLAVEELIALRARILACAVTGEPLVKPLPEPPAAQALVEGAAQ